MSCSWRLLLLLLLCVRQETELSIAVRRFVYQKDMSEYCRRRVIPSVFLGRQVVEANSQILHFSRMELPYSCFISIRTESGSNIILVIQLMSEKSLVQSCKESGNQLAVYELGETFGGYWGPLPDHLMKPEPPEDVHFYTVKTTQPRSATVFSSDEESDEQRIAYNKSEEPAVTKLLSEESPQWEGPAPGGGEDFITMELPIVNVSAKLVSGTVRTDSPFNIDEAFDIVYDVTPGVGMQYYSNVMPLVQFSVDNVVGGKRRGGGVQWRPRFGVDYVDSFTPDSRLNFLLGSTTSKRKPHRYNKYNINRRLNFKKNKSLFSANETPIRKKQHSTFRRAQYTVQPYNIFTRQYDFVKPPTPEKKVEPVSNPWGVVEDILKNLSKAKDVKTEKPNKIDSNILHRISDMEHNNSAYLTPNLSAYKKIPTSSPQPAKRYTIGAITWSLPPLSYGSNILEQLDDTMKDNVMLNDVSESTTSINTLEYTRSEDTVGTQAFTLDVDKTIVQGANVNIVDVTSKRTTRIETDASNPTTPKSSDLLTGSLVDHESWENVVQSAPVMAVILHQSAPRANSAAASADEHQPTTARPINVRKKRYVYAIPIESARPHKLPTADQRASSTTPSVLISDAQEFAELVELQDDELHSRVALRYLRQYIGPVLFNICDYDKATARHVYLFNSSRLVLAINNFTMERMTVVVTPARTLVGADARCGGAHLECQVSGARVCIDSLSACDGIPNCGSYDVYDEDRLMCGAAAGLRHNVCLAAFTFLAVLLTILYAVHYWVKRCVPKVSDAFFIYTDAAENVLYLDSIMRAPYEGDDGKPYYPSHVFEEEMQHIGQIQRKKNLFKLYFMECFNFIRCKRKKIVSRADIMGELGKVIPDGQRIYSFAEVEIDKMMRKNMTDAGVQTGSSLEMKVREKASVYKFQTDFGHVNEKPGSSRDTHKPTDYGSSPESLVLENPYDELSMLKFFKKARSVSICSSDLLRGYKVSSPHKNAPQIAEEEELQCLDLQRSELSMLPPSVDQVMTTSEVHAVKAGHVRKRLRFEEETITIQSPASYEPVIDNEERDDNFHRRSIVLGAAGRTYRSQDPDAIEECEEQGGSREYKSYFWGGKSKTKKPKKKSHVSLR